jgi:hypothetical protein
MRGTVAESSCWTAFIKTHGLRLHGVTGRASSASGHPACPGAAYHARPGSNRTVPGPSPLVGNSWRGNTVETGFVVHRKRGWR